MARDTAHGTIRSGLLHHWVERAARERPRARAIVTRDETITYGEMDACANWLARALRARGCKRGDTVAVLMSNRARAIVSFVGILKSGCAYVPLEPRHPAHRLDAILRRCKPRVLLVSGPGWEDTVEELRRRGALNGTSVGRLDTVACPTNEPYEIEPTTYDVKPDDIAYVLYTSGSMGEPKGVPITHAHVRRFIQWAVEYFELGPADRLSGCSDLTFDMSTLDIWATFAAGAELHPVPKEAQILPQQIVSFMRERALTFWFSGPSILKFVSRFDALPEDWLPSLRHLVSGGDALSSRSVNYWKRKLPDTSFTNLYGSTETTVASTYYRVSRLFEDETADVPIGRALPGEEILLLDEEGRLVGLGEVGEVHVRGVGLSEGYWKDPERTAEAFIPDPTSDDPEARVYRTGDLGRWDEEGNLHFLGRAGSRIKPAGHRVEPGDVAVRRRARSAAGREHSLLLQDTPS